MTQKRVTPEIKAYRLAIASLLREAKIYHTRAEAARYNLRFGILAKMHYDECQEAIQILQQRLDQLEQETP